MKENLLLATNIIGANAPNKINANFNAFNLLDIDKAAFLIFSEGLIKKVYLCNKYIFNLAKKSQKSIIPTIKVMEKKEKNKENLRKLTTKELQKAILQLFQQNPDKTFSPRHIISILGIANNRDSVTYAIEQLLNSGAWQLNEKQQAEKERSIERQERKEAKAPQEKKEKKKPDFTRKERNKVIREERLRDEGLGLEKKEPKKERKDFGETTKKRGGVFTGTVDMTKSGAAYIICQGFEGGDIFVPAKYLNSAMNGDTVEVRVTMPNGKSRQRRPEGEVLKVLKRAVESFMGVLEMTPRFATVITKLDTMPDVRVSYDDLKEAQEGDYVVVKITRWLEAGSRNKFLQGVITTVLGQAAGSDFEMKNILIANGFNIEFPEEVLAEAEAIEEHFEAAEIARRRDMRAITTFTIDPIDAKDFDDALSIQTLENGNLEIGVHIADVSHYLRPNTALDKEAYLRSTSVYLVDRVCPMLPEKLSNELCSLRPNEDKMTFSAVFEFDESDKLVGRWFGKTVTHSDKRFTYEAAQEVLETGEGDYSLELLTMNRIALALRKKRFKDGAVNFESDEVRFKLDENGVPIEVYVKERKDSNMLIEDFMLLANREVATYIADREKKEKTEIPFVYRIHDLPDMMKLENFKEFAVAMGVKMDLSTPKKIAASINKLVKDSEEDAALRLLMPLAIRCMAKAEYSSNNIGHYGLAFPYYSHFTSPIRRYSDVVAHRILFQNLDGRTFKKDKAILEAECQHISKQERKATQAERESIKYKQVEYMTTRIGQEFDGQISGMLDRGIFVELTENHCEGLISFDRFDEPFEIADNRLVARGLRSGKTFKMGDTVRVRILGASLEKKQIEMVLI